MRVKGATMEGANAFEYKGFIVEIKDWQTIIKNKHGDVLQVAFIPMPEEFAKEYIDTFFHRKLNMKRRKK